MKETKLNQAWNKLFKELDILNHINIYGKFEIKAATIKKYREPRLATKFDSSDQLPDLFKSNNLGIFPISRESYLIGKYNLFSLFESNEQINKVIYSDNKFQSLDFENINSESEAISIASINGILSDFLEDKGLQSTFYGKKGTGVFEFRVKGLNNQEYTIKVDGPMMEVDCSYESENNFVIIEAKRKEPKDFLVRQLYFPYRYFLTKINKKIRLVYLTYFKDKFKLYEYMFSDKDLYDSIKLVKSKSYSLKRISFQKQNFIDILNQIQLKEEPKVPFPQANKLTRIFEICELLKFNQFDRNKIKLNQNFHLRQADYYLNAGIYLGFIKKESSTYSLTNDGAVLTELSFKEKLIFVYKKLCLHKIFYNLFRKYFIDGINLNKNQTIQLMRESNLYKVKKDSTFNRRFSTVNKWFNTIISLITE